MKVSFEPLLWEDYPSINTPINAENLNRLEAGVAGLYEDMVEINIKLNGAFSEYVTDWLDEHVTPVGSAVIVDDSLSIQGAAADAKKTGDEISDLKEDLYVSTEGVTDVKSDYDFVIGSYNTYGVDNTSANRIMITNGGSAITGGGPDVLTASTNIIISHNDFTNHRIGVTTFASVGDVGVWSGWLSKPATVTAGQIFKFQVKHSNEANIASDLTADTCYTGLSMMANVTQMVAPKDYYPVRIVAQDGSAKYSTIQSAVNDANDGDIIYIKSGWYNESVVNTKQITLLGQDKHSTVLYNTTGEYATPPLWTCSGRIENLTVYAWNKNSVSFDSLTQLGYAFHLDQKWDADHDRRHIEIRNCVIKSDFNDCIGCGMDADAYIEVSDTICEATRRSGMKVHPFPTTGSSKIVLRNNVFKKGSDTNGYGLMFHTGGTDGTNFNTIEVEAYYNIAKTYYGYDTSCFIMNDYNYGNTLASMNKFSLT